VPHAFQLLRRSLDENDTPAAVKWATSCILVDEDQNMPQISRTEFEQLPLRAHQFLAGVPLHDVWAVDLPSPRPGITLDEFLRAANEQVFTLTPVVRGLLRLRLLIGRLFAWDRPQPSTQDAPTFAGGLTDADRARSLTPAGVPDGPFRVVYRFENEKLDELINRTVHAAALSALVESKNGYRFYFAVYVHNVTRLTPFYMAVIDPFRKLIIYPSLLRSTRANWERTIVARKT
jgi:Protein of unknown function (DUF2867)